MHTNLFFIVILNCFYFVFSSEIKTFVNISDGALIGSILETWTNKKILSFRGIPFAEPPIGELRFKAPVPVKPWQGIRNSTEDANVCSQISKAFGPRDENCLYLNVYSKNLDYKQPVIVFFHPGAFYSMTGASDWFGPDYLLDRDVVLVTVNYRLDALGFLSTGDKSAVGNYGLKDQVLALRWVQKNINHFGGDPNQVTIAGYSAGSRSVLLHMLSPMSRGLFQRVIAMSSGATNPWAVTKNPLERATKLSRLFNCTTENTKDMVECLRKIPADDITSKFREMRVFAGRPSVIFGPVIEPDLGDGEERFLTDHPIALFKRKEFYHVPVVTGITELEFIEWGTYVLNNETLKKRINDEFDIIAPAIFEYDDKSVDEAKKISNALRKFYFGSGEIDSNFKKELSDLFSDFSIIYSEYTTARLLAKYSDKPVYFYKLSYRGRYGYVTDPATNVTLGPAHHDDLIYLFYISRKFPRFNVDDPEAFMVNIETSFWSNFATKGDPTPDGCLFEWPPTTDYEPKYLYINNTLRMADGYPFPDRMHFWESLFPVV
ncbi:juvenile hormone esterase-like [Lycorma delicatula]|uniref:juvenile hormone esterase-like n=1 Tax=Lycorma delicatula TaxID=130591 RepID=UPI003F510ADB